jgi:hypothetical protein
MTLKTEIYTEFDHADWDHLLMKSTESTAFQMSKNYDPYKLAFNSKPLYITVEDSKGNILAQLLAVQHYHNGIHSFNNSIASKINIGSSIFWHHGPIIHDIHMHKEISTLILQKLEHFSKLNNVLIIKGSSTLMPEQSSSVQFKNVDYHNTKWDTWVIDLKKDLDVLYKSLHNKTRYDIRKGEKNNFVFEVATDRTILDEWIEIKHAANKRKNQILKKHEKFNNYLWEILYKPGFEKIYVARLDGKIISGIANKLFNKNVIQHSIINSQKNLQSGSFLTWNAMKWSKENNFLAYDMGGANPHPISVKEQGIRHYKSKWGGKEIQYDLYSKVVNKTKWRFFKLLKKSSIIR